MHAQFFATKPTQNNLIVDTFYDAATYTLTYLVYDDKTKDAIIIDSVRDYEPLASKVSWESAQKILRYIEDKNLKVHYALETHAHADHLSGAPFFREKLGAQIVIGKPITLVQETFKGVFDLDASFPTDGSQFDVLLGDGDMLQAGSILIKALSTPGHTPACMSYVIDDAVFTGDALFMPDSGVGRCDFPKGSAADLYNSIASKLYQLPDTTRVFVGHDYQPAGRAIAFETTIADSKRENIQLNGGSTQEDFIARRTARDQTLNAPRLLYQSVQVNIDAGNLPTAGKNGVVYLKTPVRGV